MNGNSQTYLVFLLLLLQIIKEVGFEGSLKEFIEMLRTEKRFYYDTRVSFLSSSEIPLFPWGAVCLCFSVQ